MENRDSLADSRLKKEQEMYRLVEDWKSSGLSMRQYALQFGLRYYSFDYWVKKHSGIRRGRKSQRASGNKNKSVSYFSIDQKAVGLEEIKPKVLDSDPNSYRDRDQRSKKAASDPSENHRICIDLPFGIKLTITGC